MDSLIGSHQVLPNGYRRRLGHGKGWKIWRETKNPFNFLYGFLTMPKAASARWRAVPHEGLQAGAV
jgi:hypothetical protein